MTELIRWGQKREERHPAWPGCETTGFASTESCHSHENNRPPTQTFVIAGFPQTQGFPTQTLGSIILTGDSPAPRRGIDRSFPFSPKRSRVVPRNTAPFFVTVRYPIPSFNKFPQTRNKSPFLIKPTTNPRTDHQTIGRLPEPVSSRIENGPMIPRNRPFRSKFRYRLP